MLFNSYNRRSPEMCNSTLSHSLALHTVSQYDTLCVVYHDTCAIGMTKPKEERGYLRCSDASPHWA